MAVVEDLKSTWDEIMVALDDADLAVFPTVPDLAARADWPDEDWRRFLMVARQAGSTIVYCQMLHIDAEEIVRFQEQVFDRPRLRRPVLAASLPEFESSPEEIAVVKALEGHTGDAFEITVGFLNGGVLHLWSGETPWWNELFSRALAVRAQQTHEVDVGADREGQRASVLADKAKKEKWAPQAAENPRLLSATSRQARIEVLCEMQPELKDVRRGWAGWSVATDLAREAEALAESEVKPRVTRQALEEAR